MVVIGVISIWSNLISHVTTSMLMIFHILHYYVLLFLTGFVFILMELLRLPLSFYFISIACKYIALIAPQLLSISGDSYSGNEMSLVYGKFI